MPTQSLIKQKFLEKLNGIIEANISREQFGVSELAGDMGMSRSNLHRKLNSITKISISQYIRQYRLKQAMELLQANSLTVSEVAFSVGFGSVTYFTKCFHDYYGFPPGKATTNCLTEVETNEHVIDENCSVCGKSIQEIKDSHEQITEVNLGTNKKRLRTKLFFTALLVIFSATFLYLSFTPFSDEHNSFGKTIAVLPFADNSPVEGNSYLINGINEEIQMNLEKIKDLIVKSPTEVAKYKDSKLSVSEMAKALKVHYILSGSGQKIQNKVRIRLQLIDVDTGNELWSKPYQHEVNDKNIFEIQDELALSVANELKEVFAQAEKK